MIELELAERLIVAADFRPSPFGIGRIGVALKVAELTENLLGTGVYLKVNSALRAGGYELIRMIRGFGLRVFADLKLYDIRETLETDGALLNEAGPELLTVACSAGTEALRALVAQLPNTEVLGLTVLTSLSEKDCLAIHGCDIRDAVNKLALLAYEARLGGVISSAKEAKDIRIIIGPNMTINTPAIRPEWTIVTNDDQNPDRIMTPAKAIAAGADRIVIGRPILQAAPNDKGLPQNPREAVERTLQEIADGLATRQK